MRQPCTAIIVFTASILLSAGPSIAQPSGSAADGIDNAPEGAFALFLEPFGANTLESVDFLDAIAAHERLGTFETATFDDLDAWPVNTQVQAVVVDDVELAILATTARGGPFVFHPAGFFNWEDQVFAGTLVVGDRARLMPLRASDSAGAAGFWIFDDGNLRDSIYEVTVVDACGHSVTAVVENATPRVSGYEVEGFFGVIAEFGIVEISITALDAATREPWSDPFELDHLTVARMETSRPCVADTPPTDDAGACRCVCGHTVRELPRESCDRSKRDVDRNRGCRGETHGRDKDRRDCGRDRKQNVQKADSRSGGRNDNGKGGGRDVRGADCRRR